MLELDRNKKELATSNIFGDPGKTHIPEANDVAARRLGFYVISDERCCPATGLDEIDALRFNYTETDGLIIFS